MTIGVQSGTPEMCKAMDTPYQRECVPVYSGVKAIMATKTILVLGQSNTMMYKDIKEQNRRWVSS